MLCRLCGRNKAIGNSHIIPAFVGKWLKRSSATGYMRAAVTPNLRKQDIVKLPLLCEVCEEQFSKWETYFANEIFHPYQEGRQATFRYDQRLLLFAISLSWRVGVADRESFKNFKPALVSRLDAALEIWRALLLSKSFRPQLYEHHIFFLGTVARAESELPEGFQWYTLRSVDATLPANDTELAVYTKLPGMFFFSSVHPSNLVGWENTRILGSGVVEASHQRITDPSLGEFLLHRADRVNEAFDDLSDGQRRKIEESMRRNPDRTIESKSFQVHLIELLLGQGKGDLD